MEALMTEEDARELRDAANQELGALLAFYGAMLAEFDDWIRTPTAAPQGAPRVMKRLALRWGLPVERIPLPKLSREEEDRLGRSSRPNQGPSRH